MELEMFALVTNPKAQNGGLLQDALSYVRAEFEKSTTIVVVSAYYSDTFVLKLLAGLNLTRQRRSRNITFIFAAAPSIKREEQKNALSALKRNIVEGGYFDEGCVEIKLATRLQFLHAKIISCKSPGRKPSYIVGSANFSSAAYEAKNDEVMVAIRGEHYGLFQYMQHVDKSSDPIEDVGVELKPIEGWQNFLKEGKLYFKPSRSISYTVDPFEGAEFDEISKRLRERSGRLPFSSSSSISINLLAFLNIDEVESSTAKFQLTSCSVQTDYGYWVPGRYVAAVDEMIAEVSAPRKSSLRVRAAALQDVKNQQIEDNTTRYVDAVIERLANDVKPIYLPAEASALIKKKIIDRARHLVKMLSRDETIARLSTPLIGRAVPEFWEDPVSTNYLFDSYCFDIWYKTSLPKKSSIIKHLASKFAVNENDTPASCRMKIEKWFETNAWPVGGWPPLPSEKDQMKRNKSVVALLRARRLSK